MEMFRCTFPLGVSKQRMVASESWPAFSHCSWVTRSGGKTLNSNPLSLSWVTALPMTMLASSQTASRTSGSAGSTSPSERMLATSAGGGGRTFQNYGACDRPAKTAQCGGPFLAVAVFFHGEVHDFRRSLHHFGQHGIERADKWLDQV